MLHFNLKQPYSLVRRNINYTFSGGEQHGRMQQVEFERMRATESKQNGVHPEIFDV